VKKIEDVKILVVGDIMLDKYVLGDVERISPEAPVPIVKVVEEYETLGGCGNVVRNISGLGAQEYCAASIARDNAGDTIIEHLNQVGAKSLLILESKITTVKERIIADQRKVQMIRIDKEDTETINHEWIIDVIEKNKEDYDMIVVSDYAKGMISHGLITYFNRMETPLIIDPKPQNKSMYGNHPFMITPNEKESKEMGGAKSLIANGFKYVLETRGKNGMVLFEGADQYAIQAEEVEVYNVSGAGDTVVAVMAVCISMGLNPLEAAEVANKCAGYVVTQIGTSTVPKNIFINNLGMYYTNNK
jgi:rfaE bifunctional protein kinase chain/domain